MTLRYFSLSCVVVIAAFCAGCEGRSRSARVIEVPYGFQGWATIEYSKTSCPRLARKNGVITITLSADGYACTSSQAEDGWGLDSYVSVSGQVQNPLSRTESGKGGSIWGNRHRTSVYPERREIEQFFVGSEQAYRLAVAAGTK
jgi:hypothetical protein